MKETLGGQGDWQPNLTPKSLVEGVAVKHPLGYFTQKDYPDGVRVLVEPFGDTNTFFPDGGIHREHPVSEHERYTPPKNQP